jgi:mono/diheme cytochrome c family protein
MTTTPATQNRSRLLAFKLGGRGTVPAAPPRTFAKPFRPLQPAALAKRGGQLFSENVCAACHGLNAEKGGLAVPDLRRSSAMPDIVIRGAYLPLGMPAFPKLTTSDIEAIQAFLTNSAWAAYDAQQGVQPARELPTATEKVRAESPAATPEPATTSESTPTPQTSNSAVPASMQELAGKAFASHCAQCHSLFGVEGFKRLTPDEFYSVLRHGQMQEPATGLDDGTLHALAATFGNPEAASQRPPNGGARMCSEQKPATLESNLFDCRSRGRSTQVVVRDPGIGRGILGRVGKSAGGRTWTRVCREHQSLDLRARCADRLCVLGIQSGCRNPLRRGGR